MDDHSHHHHHHPTTTENATFDALPTTTAATILQSVISTMMAAHGGHQRHAGESQHAGHSLDLDQMAGDASSVSDVHSTHVQSGDHMQVGAGKFRAQNKRIFGAPDVF